MYEDNRLYPADSAELNVLGTYSTLAHWRSQGTGPTYIKLGKRVAYRGRDLNEWIERKTVQTEAA